MGQAALDLPDPLQKPSLDHVPSADDLLAQMATAEIDRLLAETEEGPPLSPEPHTADDPIAQARAVAADEVAQLKQPEQAPEPPPPAPAPKPGVDPATAIQIDALFEQLDETPAAPALELPPDAPAPPPQPAPAIDLPTTNEAPAAPASAPEIPSGLTLPLQSESEIARELERLFRGLSPTVEQASAAPAPTAAAAPAALAKAAQPTESAITPVASTSAEKQALDLAQDMIDNIPPAPAASAAPAEPRPSLLLRLLEILSAPMDIFGDDVRETLGKIAIVTLINALAILIYVVLFRT